MSEDNKKITMKELLAEIEKREANRIAIKKEPIKNKPPRVIVVKKEKDWFSISVMLLTIAIIILSVVLILKS